MSPTDEMFGHPLATLAVANDLHLDAIGLTPLTCSDKSCGANSIDDFHIGDTLYCLYLAVPCPSQHQIYTTSAMVNEE